MINRENLIKIGRAGGNTSNRETPDQIGRVGMSENKWETFEEHKSQEGAAIIFSSSKFSQCTPVFILIFLPQVAVMLQCWLHFVSPQHFDHCEDEYHW